MSGEPAIEQRDDGSWRVRAERRHGEAAATGAVDAPTREAAAGAAHIAAGLAWAALGRARLGAGDVEGALASARAGIEELGELPVNPDVIDDTELKLYAAEDRVASGHPADGATVMLNMLEIRAELHADALGVTIAPTG